MLETNFYLIVNKWREKLLGMIVEMEKQIIRFTWVNLGINDGKLS